MYNINNIFNRNFINVNTKTTKKRWLTPKGQEVRQQIIEHIREDNWEKFLKGFPFVEEVKNGRDLRFIDLNGANLKEADLWSANLSESCFKEANLNGANLMGAYLYSANLRGAKLNGATLLETDLVGADLREAELNRTNFMRADLGGIDLRRTKMNRALLRNCIINQANLSGADLTGTYIYGISAWDIKTDENTIMKNLVISENPLITVDDIEIAQFIHLILNNKKISNIITSMRTKCVLILGSFDDDSMPILNKLTEILPEYNLVPIIFYFKAPKEHSLMETVRTMALLSKFVIVDLSKRSGQLYEIANLVNNIKVPYVTIAVEGTKVSGILEDLHDYY